MSACLTRFKPHASYLPDVQLHLWTRRALDSVIVHCVGNIVYQEEADSLIAAVASLDSRRIVIDLKHVRTVDAYGLGKLLHLHQTLPQRFQQIVFVNPNERLQLLFCITKLDFAFATDCGRVIRRLHQSLEPGVADSQL